MRGQAKLGIDIPADAIEAYERVKDEVDLASIASRERITRHDVKARIEEFCDRAGHEHIHKGLDQSGLDRGMSNSCRSTEASWRSAKKRWPAWHSSGSGWKSGRGL